MLNRSGVVRLCYCGPVLHARATGSGSTREPLQFGAEIYGHEGLAADRRDPRPDARVPARRRRSRTSSSISPTRASSAPCSPASPVDANRLEAVYAALAAKDTAELRTLSAGFPAPARQGAGSARRPLRRRRDARTKRRAASRARRRSHAALGDLRTLAAHAREAHPRARVGFDLADSSGYAYYSGARFAAYARGASDAIARGGRYDEVGAIFGRNRPAVGFGLDVKDLAMLRAAAACTRADPRAARRRCRAARCGARAARGAARSSSPTSGRRRSRRRGRGRAPAGRIGRPLDRRQR